MMRDDEQSDTNEAGSLKRLPFLPGIALPTALFGLYTFILMSTGTQGDNMLTGWGADDMLYNLREGLLLAGFLLYGVVSWKRPRIFTDKVKKSARVVLAALYACCATAMLVAPFGAPLVIAAMTMSLVVGLTGGAVYEKVALFASAGPAAKAMAPDAQAVGPTASSKPPAHPSSMSGEREPLMHDAALRTLGVVVGLGGALAVIAQYLLQLQFSLGGWFVALLAVVFCLLMCLMGAEKAGLAPCSAETLETIVCAPADVAVNGQGLRLVAVVACLFALFSFYEPVIRDAFTWIVFYQWHRLFLIAGYLVIGAAAFFGGRPAASLAVAIAALFTAFILTQTALLQVDNFTMAMFYALLGAVIAYSGISFMSLAPHTGRPALVASAGRMLECTVTIAGGIVASSLDEWPVSAVLFASLVLIALTIVLMVRGGFFAYQTSTNSQKAEEQAEGSVTLGANAMPDANTALDMKGSASDAETSSTGKEAQPAAMDEPLPDKEEQPAPNGPNVAAIAKRYGLTRRETEVLDLVLRGLTVQQMADELVVTKSTVKFHVTNILKKTNSETRQQLLEKLSVEPEPSGK